MSGVIAAAAVLLVAAGVVKVRRPASASSAMTAARLPLPRWTRSTTAMRLLGLGEMALGLWSLVAGALGYLALALAYAVLAAFALRLRLVDRRASCGCFGTASAGVSVFHVVLCTAAAATAEGAAVLDLPSPLANLAALGGLAAAYVLLVAGLSYLAFLLLTDLPRLLEAARRPAGSTVAA